jgi:hypothetical protein
MFAFVLFRPNGDVLTTNQHPAAAWEEPIGTYRYYVKFKTWNVTFKPDGKLEFPVWTAVSPEEVPKEHRAALLLIL